MRRLHASAELDAGAFLLIKYNPIQKNSQFKSKLVNYVTLKLFGLSATCNKYDKHCNNVCGIVKRRRPHFAAGDTRILSID